jgi:predicted DNA-binding protein with PD1-like motif
MKSKLLIDASGAREWAVIFDAGDEVADELARFAADQRLSAASFTGIGALSDVTTAWFNPEAKKYEPTEIREQVELLSMAGDVAEGPDGKPAVHAHVVVGKRDGTAYGGHLLHAHVRPTLELIVTEAPAHLRKTFRPEFGLALIDIGKSGR